MNQKQTEDYLELVFEQVAALNKRESMLMFITTSDEEEVLERKEIEKKITCYDEALRAFENEVSFGIGALVGNDASTTVRNSVALLIAKALRFSDINDITDLASLAAGDAPVGLLEIHEAFATNGILRPFCTARIQGAANLGELSRVSLKESAFRLVLGLDPDTQIDDYQRLVTTQGR